MLARAQDFQTFGIKTLQTFGIKTLVWVGQGRDCDGHANRRGKHIAYLALAGVVKLGAVLHGGELHLREKEREEET